jgi:hypothetical protein
VHSEFAAISDGLVGQRLERDRRIGEKTLRCLDVHESLHCQDEVGIVGGREVCAQAVFLVLLLQSGYASEAVEHAHQNALDAGLLGCPPALLAADDLVVAGSKG